MSFTMEAYTYERSLNLSSPIDRSLMCCGRRGSARVKGYENQKRLEDAPAIRYLIPDRLHRVLSLNP